MKAYSPLFLLAALGVLSAAGTAAAQADTSQWKCESCPYPKGSTGSVNARKIFATASPEGNTSCMRSTRIGV